MRSVIAMLLLLITAIAQAQHDHSAAAPVTATAAHVAPDAPATVMGDMSPRQMVQMMQMDDAAHFGSLMVDEFEWRNEADALAWQAAGWYGGDVDRLLVRTEGEDHHSRNEVLWDHALNRWWNLQGGVRYDSGDGPSRTWAAVGMEGLAPWWIDIDAAFYMGDEGRTAARFEARYDLRLTQRLLLQPRLELNAYGRNDPERHIGSGLSGLAAGLRLRYEVRREFAPYIGVHWKQLFGNTADLADAEGTATHETQFVAGVRFWF